MKILLSPSKEMDRTNLILRVNDVNIDCFYDKLNMLKCELSDFETINKLSKKAILLYSGLAFRQFTNKESSFYQNVIILSSLYGYSYGNDYISCYILDYTTSLGRIYKKDIYDEINHRLKTEDIVYNLASDEYAKGIKHDNLVNFKFLVLKNGVYKSISATSKKMRGKMVEFIRLNNSFDFENFNDDGFKYCYEKSKANNIVYKKSSKD
ncbi:MAG: peroxide stress protein YaaA [Bacilli bacterium]